MVSGTIRALRWTRRRETAGTRLDPRTKKIRAKRLLLLQVLSNLGDHCRGQCLIDQGTVRGSARADFYDAIF